MEVINDLQEPNTEEKKEKSKEKEYHLPDGFGLSIEEVQNIINQKCSVSVPKDDPIMLIVSILNAFLFEQQKLQEEYKEGLKEVYQEVLNTFLEQLDKQLQSKNYTITATETPKNKKINENWMLYVVIIFLIFALLAVYFGK